MRNDCLPKGKVRRDTTAPWPLLKSKGRCSKRVILRKQKRKTRKGKAPKGEPSAKQDPWSEDEKLHEKEGEEGVAVVEGVVGCGGWRKGREGGILQNRERAK